ncbi:hypothetical protein AVEN_31939-1 [Araneus ventricosus]|uniref:Uncharacterized protein n=1 Tax=Araneus ventricosus TaxID=182803 RepID=A0A4Y2XB92_ARAVE|nr:hypothetical protein AVEN_31939-1 [Araneus ventricosus]
MAASLTKTTIVMKRNIFRNRHEKLKLNGTYVKVRVENIGIEKNDQLTKAAIDVEQSYIKLPKILIGNRVRKVVLDKLQVHRIEGGTGRSVYNIIPMVSPLSTNWLSKDIIFFSEHVSFSVFKLAHSDFCIRGGIVTALHYAT